MKKDLEFAYVLGCLQCQQNKSQSSRPAGPLYPLSIPDMHGDSVAVDFISPLPEDDGYTGIVTMLDRLGGADVRAVAIAGWEA